MGPPYRFSLAGVSPALPIQVEGALHTGWIHILPGWCSLMFPLRMCHLALWRQLPHFLFPAVCGVHLCLPPGEVPVIGELGIMLQGAQLVWVGLLCFPLPEVLLHKLFTDVQAQGSMVGDIIPTKTGLMGQPRVDVPKQDSGQLTSLPNLPTIEGLGDVILPILE